MTRRERREAKVERRLEWAIKADDRATTAFTRANSIAERFHGGQPILVGHHSEASARVDQRRIHNAMDRGVAEQRKAEHHRGTAINIRQQLDRTVFSDDENAIEALQARITGREAEAVRMAAMNAAWRRAKGDTAKFATLAGISEALAQSIAERIADAYSWEKQPYASWELSNLRANIRRDRERVSALERQNAR